MPITRAVADVAERLTPRSWARVGRSTTARMRRPSVVWRSSSHSPTRARAAVMNTISWSLSSTQPPGIFHVFFGDGPMPGRDEDLIARIQLPVGVDDQPLDDEADHRRQGDEDADRSP